MAYDLVDLKVFWLETYLDQRMAYDLVDLKVFWLELWCVGNQWGLAWAKWWALRCEDALLAGKWWAKLKAISLARLGLVSQSVGSMACQTLGTSLDCQKD